jgi:hypothetical protein
LILLHLEKEIRYQRWMRGRCHRFDPIDRCGDGVLSLCLCPYYSVLYLRHHLPRWWSLGQYCCRMSVQISYFSSWPRCGRHQQQTVGLSVGLSDLPSKWHLAFESDSVGVDRLRLVDSIRKQRSLRSPMNLLRQPRWRPWLRRYLLLKMLDGF